MYINLLQHNFVWKSHASSKIKNNGFMVQFLYKSEITASMKDKKYDIA